MIGTKSEALDAGTGEGKENSVCGYRDVLSIRGYLWARGRKRQAIFSSPPPSLSLVGHVREAGCRSCE